MMGEGILKGEGGLPLSHSLVRGGIGRLHLEGQTVFVASYESGHYPSVMAKSVETSLIRFDRPRSHIGPEPALQAQPTAHADSPCSDNSAASTP